ncbi:PREDICTED: LOW QUALITY PROTEIN: heterogeneous nuclear ribonucleoproteins A2/B1-like [Priapulus caudatus]|uniref:LOW QUALITY PROTEIN: heterogeneous nuclear ribonucleoproteins A2/B1-like n=1 Tax=Priapulus caudatus TaxID=37621 RepID=A0ABM1F2K1_PRICU|nr:PREDICTED: LOW QUALITY PROTEIN: heterogeneous nuclear ribonucleoproteins A2/B1-like [Priapulus caudatus]
MEDYFQQWGKVVACNIQRRAFTNESRCCGFVTYSETSQLDDCMKNRPHIIDGKEVKTVRVSRRGEEMTVKKIIVGGKITRKNPIWEYFMEYANVTSVDFIMVKRLNRKRFAFVSFDDYDPVDKIVLKRHHIINGNTLDVDKAVDRGCRASGSTSLPNTDTSLSVITDAVSHLSMDLERLLGQQSFSDVTLYVGGREVQAHKAILSVETQSARAERLRGILEVSLREVEDHRVKKLSAQNLNIRQVEADVLILSAINKGWSSESQC